MDVGKVEKEVRKMKQIKTVTIPQVENETRISMTVYQGDEFKYMQINIDDPKVPPLMPMKIETMADCDLRILLYMVRGMIRVAENLDLDFPSDLKEYEKEMPAFVSEILRGELDKN
jgi:hypothetical protein